MVLPAGAMLTTAHTPALAGRWRWRSMWVSFACLALGLIYFIIDINLAFDQYGDELPEYLDGLLLLDLLLGIAACALAGSMHRAGRWNLLLVLVSGVSSMAAPAASIAAIRLGARRRRSDAIVVMLASIVCQVGLATLIVAPVEAPSWSDLIGVPIVGGVTWGCVMWGRSRADRADLLASLQEQANAAARERDAVEQQRLALRRTRTADLARTRADERTAIARDMHDSLSHHLALIAMHAGALAYREDMPPETMRTTARTLRDAAQAANTELRGVLSALRSPEGLAVDEDGVSTASTAPLATVADMRESIARARRSGQSIMTTYTGLDENDLTHLPPTTAAALDRIVGELVVNAAKHAPGATLHLDFAHPDDHLVVRATNPRRRTEAALGTGLGLVGITERARLLGGDAIVDTVTGGSTDADTTDFTVEVRIPWRR